MIPTGDPAKLGFDPDRLARLTRSDPVPVRFKLFPDAHHGFDIEGFGSPRFVGQEINPDG